MTPPWMDDRLASNGRRISENFHAWFGNSAIVDAKGNPMVVYHGTRSEFDNFEGNPSGIHFGPVEQAAMRSGYATIIPAYLSIQSIRRTKDKTHGWKATVANAKAAGFDGIVYLNRVEGISADRFQEVFARCVSADALDNMPDAMFKKLFPEARDSYIVFDPANIKSTTGNSGLYSKFSNTLIDHVDDLRLRQALTARKSVENRLALTHGR